MRYYDNAFRKNLIDMLNTYRRILSQIELSQDKNFSNIFISDSIKKIDEAVKIIKPSAFDFLTEKKIEKLQTSEYLKQETEKTQKEFEAKEKQLEQETEKNNKVLEEKVRSETENQLREKLAKEIRAELETQIRKEIADKATSENARRNQINERIRKLRERAGATINANGANTDTERKTESTTSENTEDNAFTDFDDEDNIPPVE